MIADSLSFSRCVCSVMSMVLDATCKTVPTSKCLLNIQEERGKGALHNQVNNSDCNRLFLHIQIVTRSFSSPHHQPPPPTEYTVWNGLIDRRVVFDDKLWPRDPCKSVQVKWYGEDVGEENEDACYDNISPWDVVPASHFQQDAIDQKLRAEIEKALDIWRGSNLEETEPFLNNPADDVGNPYLQVVQLPMYINLIQDRLKNDYYRSIESLRADIDMLFTNCAKYNQNDNEICMTSKVVRAGLLSLVEQANRECFDGPVVPNLPVLGSYGYGGPSSNYGHNNTGSSNKRGKACRKKRKR